MEKYSLKLAYFIFFVTIIYSCASSKELQQIEINFQARLAQFTDTVRSAKMNFDMPVGTEIKSGSINTDAKLIQLEFNRYFSFRPFREDDIPLIYNEVKNFFGPEFNNYWFEISTTGYKIENLIPNYFRADKNDYDTARLPKENIRARIPLVKNISSGNTPSHGLTNTNIALWHSHGWYYSQDAGRWEWQRPRLFQTVEDFLPLSITIPYLIPMLENAGANVFIPRERDPQKNVVVIDNDMAAVQLKGKFSETDGQGINKWKNGSSEGFAEGDLPYVDDFNPFKAGTFRYIESDNISSARTSWIPEIPETGDYAVYISYGQTGKNVSDAHYTVWHDGGKTEFSINQTIGAGTWIYLGTFRFRKGLNSESGVFLTNKSNETGRFISADAVRFGGGFGIVQRGGIVSGRPKFYEGARYYLQYAGMPADLIYALNDGISDYKDDYQCRGEWVNYLRGAPAGPNIDRSAAGLGIPIDLSMAFHTDAGISKDTTIGTLSIYSIMDAESLDVFPDGMSRLANRDLADILQTQLVNDLRINWDTTWNRRQLMNSMYSEAFRPNVPAVLLELLSHQNFLDMRYMNDPRFKFTVGRSIYKAMLKFIASQNSYDYVVQPLPVNNFLIKSIDGKSVELRWNEVTENGEPNSAPKYYKVYTRIGDGGFDNGRIVNGKKCIIENMLPGQIYSFKVTALNSGGESFPSEILSAGYSNSDIKPVLIVNNFDRVSAPAWIETDEFSGFLSNLDAGVPDKLDYSYTGLQYDFDPNSLFISNDAPGFGASRGDYETEVIPGNSFDYPSIHGKAMIENGLSFVSCSEESVENGQVNLNDFDLVDIICGEEKNFHEQKKLRNSRFTREYSVLGEKLRNLLTGYFRSNGRVIISGAYIGSDIFKSEVIDSSAILFATDILRIKLATGFATGSGEFFTLPVLDDSGNNKYSFQTTLLGSSYQVESPDAINPVKGSEVLLRYKDNNFSASVGFKNESYSCITIGFPFETVNSASDRKTLMGYFLRYLGMN